MEQVLDSIQQSLPPQISERFSVGPMQDFNLPVNDDLRLPEPSTGYGLMDSDEQVALATAAAAAAMAMEHQNKRKPRYHRMGHVSNQERLRALAASLPQQRERVEEVIQGLRERTPEVIQGIRHRTPELIQGIRERTPEVLQEIRDKTPEVLQGIREYVREHVYGDHPPRLDCDAAGRSISNTAYYNNSLNEEEPREQPPRSSYQGSQLQQQCHQAWNNLYQPKNQAAEYYVNFEDGDSHDAVSHATGAAAASRPSKVISVSTEYADMDDPLDVSTSPPPMKAEPAEQPIQGRPIISVQRKWGAIHEEEKEVSACEDVAETEHQEHPREESETLEINQVSQPRSSLHSTTKYQWGATPNTPSSELQSSINKDEKLCEEVKSDETLSDDTEEASHEGNSSSLDDDLLVDLSSPKNEHEHETESHNEQQQAVTDEENNSQPDDHIRVDLSSPKNENEHETESHNEQQQSPTDEENNSQPDEVLLVDLSSPKVELEHVTEAHNEQQKSPTEEENKPQQEQAEIPVSIGDAISAPIPPPVVVLNATPSPISSGPVPSAESEAKETPGSSDLLHDDFEV